MYKVSCAECPLRKYEIFEPFTAEEIAFMHSFKAGELVVEPGTTVMMEGMPSPQLYTILEGLGVRYRTLEDGERQVINFALPGDLIGLQAALMGEMSHSFEATTDMRLCVFNKNDLWRLFQHHPQRSYDLTWLSAVEEHFLGEALSTLGRRSAVERVGWALLRVHARLRAVGLESNGAVPMPWRQRDLADALGLSLVHTNKTLQKLRADNLAQWVDGMLSIPDPFALAQVASVDLEAPQRRPLI
jgi:CRP/FNR family transcriptional regulator, anaerobic regulatory protein